MKQYVMLFEDFRESLKEANYNYLRWRWAVTKDYKYAGKIDSVKGDNLIIELNSKGDSITSKVKNTFIIDMTEEEMIDIMIDNKPPGDNDESEKYTPMPKENKAYFSKYFKDKLIDATAVEESDIYDMNEAVLAIAGGVVLGLAGWWALKKGAKWVSANVGPAIEDYIDKVEAKLAAKEAIKNNKELLDKIQPIADKLATDKKLMDMYKSLPEYTTFPKSQKAKTANKERTKQLNQIAKYIKGKLSKDEEFYFSKISKLLRTGTLESNDIDSIASFEYLEECLSAVNSSIEDLNEARTITYKRKYTENHPAKSAGFHGRVRDRVLELMSDKKMTQEEFDKIVQEFNLSKRWIRNNSNLFKIKGGMVALSETGRRIWKAKTPKVNESK